MRILITAGGTREYIDPVRFISNASTGKMGYALAQKASARGHVVTLVTGPTAIKPPSRVHLIHVVTSADMFKAVKDNFDACDCLIMAAAVSDYTPLRTSETKIKKSAAPLTIELKPTTDILKWAGRNKNGQILVGFALEDESLREHAEQKLRDKNLDLIVANAPGAVGADVSTVHIKPADGPWTTLAHTAKTKIAGKLLAQIEALARSRPA
ncbi:MAG: phosphopantothenoylcysteine decarboxylase [Phycisphaerae bacterium]|nr:phosphopantothenoylcysteine decarboxylase [Phycisphaerae bacterium]